MDIISNEPKSGDAPKIPLRSLRDFDEIDRRVSLLSEADVDNQLEFFSRILEGVRYRMFSQTAERHHENFGHAQSSIEVGSIVLALSFFKKAKFIRDTTNFVFPEFTLATPTS